ncbi:MAG: hypothetical protein IKA85_04110 [Clostridia bacterium]|nr:hypothetical protein [Clostridia bacterium]
MKNLKMQYDYAKNGKFEMKNTVKPKDYPNYFKSWQDKMPSGWCTVYSIGESGGFPILVAEFTNPEVKREEKEIAMVIAQHSLELSGVNTVFSLGNYLSKMDELAVEIMTKQVVVVMPAHNMFSLDKFDIEYQFKNHAGVDEYQAFEFDGTVDKVKYPAAYALKTLVDKLKPELILDIHGVWAVGAGLFESTGGYSHANLNYCYDSSFTKAMNKAAEEKGYAIHDEDDRQSLRPCDPICFEGRNRELFKKGRPSKLLSLYTYLNYHTLFINFEACYEESALCRTIEALRLGCHPIAPVVGAGYPVRNIKPFTFSNSLLCGGKNAKERRESRVELWQNIHRISCGAIAAEIHGAQGYFVVTNQKKIREIFGDKGRYQTLLKDAYPIFEKMGCKTDRMQEIFKVYEDNIYFYYFDVAEEFEQIKIKNGITLRMEIPHKDAEIQEVLLNGIPLSEKDYVVTRYKNFTLLDVTVDCENLDLVGLVCKYDYKKRSIGIIE